MLVAYSNGARTGELVFGLIFIGLGSGGMIHALNSRRRWLKSGGEPLPEQHEKARLLVSKYKPLLLGVGILAVIGYSFTGHIIPKTAADIHRPLPAGMFLFLGISNHITWLRIRRWLAQQQTAVQAIGFRG